MAMRSCIKEMGTFVLIIFLALFGITCQSQDAKKSEYPRHLRPHLGREALGTVLVSSWDYYLRILLKNSPEFPVVSVTVLGGERAQILIGFSEGDHPELLVRTLTARQKKAEEFKLKISEAQLDEMQLMMKKVLMNVRFPKEQLDVLHGQENHYGLCSNTGLFSGWCYSRPKNDQSEPAKLNRFFKIVFEAVIAGDKTKITKALKAYRNRKNN